MFKKKEVVKNLTSSVCEPMSDGMILKNRVCLAGESDGEEAMSGWKCKLGLNIVRNTGSE